MKSIKIAFLILAVGFIFSCNKKSTEVAVAPPPTQATTPDTPDRPQRGEGRRGQRDPEAQQKRQDEMYAQLNLSEAQKTKLDEITAQFGEKRRAAFQGGRDGDREARRTAMQKLREEYNENIKKVLTAEQFEKFQKIQAEQRGKRSGRRGGGRNGG